jgi:hypothetical protein
MILPWLAILLIAEHTDQQLGWVQTSGQDPADCGYVTLKLEIFSVIHFFAFALQHRSNFNEDSKLVGIVIHA